MRTRIKPINCMAMALGVGLSIPALAQEATEAGSRLALEEVVVTARRTAEFVQDVPIAISAMSADDLQRENIGTMQDFQGKVPSLTIGSNGQMRNTETPTIRGQGATYSAGPGVIIYWGEVAFPSDVSTNAQGGPGKFFDLANVQILKGAQGTLFGRNTTGGALLLEPNTPQGVFSASVKAEATSYSGRGYEAVLNTPLIEDTLLMRVGGWFFDREGFTKDAVTGKDYDNKHFWTSRLGLTWYPTDVIENTLLGYYTDSDDNGTGTVIESMNTNYSLCRVMPLIGHPNCAADVVAAQQARGHRRVQLSADSKVLIQTGALIDQFSYEVNDQLTIRNILSYSTFEHLYRWDQDGSLLALSDQTTPNDERATDQKVYTEELQLQGTAFDDNLDYVIGAYYEFTKADGVATNTSQVVSKAVRQYELEKETYAPFAQGTYDLGGVFDSLSGLSLTVGARYTTDKVEGAGRVTQWIDPSPALASFRADLATGMLISDPVVNESVKKSAFTFTVGLDYKFDNHMVYGKISRGYKGGGLQVTAVNPENVVFDPEFVLNYELGLKSDFKVAGMPARVNTAIYYTDYTDMQKTGADSRDVPGSSQPMIGAATFNVGQAWIAGFEIDGSIQPLPGLTFSANYSYTDAEYEEFELPVNREPNNASGVPQGLLDCSGQLIRRGGKQDLSCIPLQGVAEHQGSVTVRYVLPLDAEIGEVESSLTYSSSSRQYSAPTSVPDAEPGAWLPSYGLLNASLSWRGIFGTAFDAQLYGTNLTDEEYRISNSNVFGVLGYRSSIYSEPRIVGVKVGYNWK